MLNKSKIEEIDDMLLHVLDALSANSSDIQVIKMMAGSVKRKMRDGSTLTVDEVADNADVANNAAAKTVNALRTMLKEIQEPLTD